MLERIIVNQLATRCPNATSGLRLRGHARKSLSLFTSAPRLFCVTFARCCPDHILGPFDRSSSHSVQGQNSTVKAAWYPHRSLRPAAAVGQDSARFRANNAVLLDDRPPLHAIRNMKTRSWECGHCPQSRQLVPAFPADRAAGGCRTDGLRLTS